jgi:ubiquinone biosynthesis protein COQ9
MIGTVERSPERDSALAAALPHVPPLGWTISALRQGLRDLGGESGSDPADAELLFPGGGMDMIEAFADLTDRRMEAEAAALNLPALRVPARVRALIELRLRLLRPDKAAMRRAVGKLALPGRKPVALACTARTVDAIWHAAGDASADFSWYTKRAILAGVYGSTLLFWLSRHDEDDAATLAFLDRRLEGVAAIGKLRRRCEGVFARFKPAHPDAEAA